MKRILIFSLCILLLLNVLSSCVQKDNYIVEYPEMYTTTYCSENYIEADPNLVHLRAADNDLGKIDVPGGNAKYCAIKDVPLDEYLLFDEYVMFAPLSYQIVKNKNNTALPVQEILSYKIKSVDLYLPAYWKDIYLDKRELGRNWVKEQISSVDVDGAIAFQTYVIECFENGNLIPMGDPAYELTSIQLRVIFEDYENLVWDSSIYSLNGNYYILFYTWETDGWAQNLMPLEQGIVELVCDYLE